MRAGLTYVTDGFAGIRRQHPGGGWIFFAPNGARIRDPAKRKRLSSLAIPPAWTDVWICPDPSGHIQATARDARGRKQYRYHSSYREARDQSKFRHMLEFSEILPRLRERIERDLRAEDLTRRQLLATVIRLLDKTLIRVGNDEYARENRSFGLTTLRRRHVEVKGASLRFTFRGKSGVEHKVALTDGRLARIIQRCQDLPGTELFQYLDAFGSRQTVMIGRRERAPAGDHRARRHGQGFPHLGRHDARGGGAALDGAGDEPPRSRPQYHPRHRPGVRAARQHALRVPQILRPSRLAARLSSGAHRGAASRGCAAARPSRTVAPPRCAATKSWCCNSRRKSSHERREESRSSPKTARRWTWWSLNKRAELSKVVVGEGVHSVRCTLVPTRNAMAYVSSVMGREIVYERSRDQVQADIDRLNPSLRKPRGR